MSLMLPALVRDRLSLADVLPSCLAALAGADNLLGLPTAPRILVIVVDGLGALQLHAHAGHARFLAPLAQTSIDSVFPTTTASALTSLATGTRPGSHGLVGYTVLDADRDRVVNQLTGWDEDMRPELWQRERTVWELAARTGVEVSAVGPAQYAGSGFSRAILRGARYHSATTVAQRLDTAVRLLGASSRALVYAYIPELDTIGHARGPESALWREALEDLDRDVRVALSQLPAASGVLLTADHGQVTIAAHQHILFDQNPELLRGIRHVGGEPRALHLYVDPNATPEERALLKQAWTAAESDRAWVVDRRELIDSGWLGEVAPEVESRIGDLVIAARKRVAYYDSRADPRARGMIGQHGSFTPEELQVPLVRLGEFAGP